MKKRAAEMNGRFEIKSEAGHGTTITFQLPLDASDRRAQKVVSQISVDK
jgi:chemotaxis protein histidine kinase CheA